MRYQSETVVLELLRRPEVDRAMLRQKSRGDLRGEFSVLSLCEECQSEAVKLELHRLLNANGCGGESIAQQSDTTEGTEDDFSKVSGKFSSVFLSRQLIVNDAFTR